MSNTIPAVEDGMDSDKDERKDTGSPSVSTGGQFPPGSDSAAMGQPVPGATPVEANNGGSGHRLRYATWNAEHRRYGMRGPEDEEMEDEYGEATRPSATDQAFHMLTRYDELRDLLAAGRRGAKDDDPDFKMEEPELPDVVAIGDQSHGKSSLLERMFGISFPAGPMMKTRMFCEVRCRKLSDKDEPFATVGCPMKSIDERQVPLKDVPKAIDKITDDVAPGQKVSNAVITVTVYRHGLPPMMVVDTIGLIANPRRNQDEDLPRQIEEMARRRIQNENCLILVVLSILQDPSNARSLRLANAIDPLHKRTMVVFTHADKCEEVSLQARLKGMYEEAGYNFPKSSIFVVRNRTDVETQEGMSLQELDDLERRALDRFRGIPRECRGCAKATHYVSHRLCEAVCKVLPKTQMYLESQLKHLQARKEKLDVSELQDDAQRHQVFYSHFTKFTQLLQNSMRGEPGRFGEMQLSALNLALYKLYKEQVEKVHPLQEFSGKAILDEIKRGWMETAGHEAIPGELHPKIAIRLLNHLLQDLHRPSQELVTAVAKQVSDKMVEIAQLVFMNFPALQDRVCSSFNQYIFERTQETAKQVERHVNMQCNPPYTLFSITGDMAREYKEQIGDKFLQKVQNKQPGGEQKGDAEAEAEAEVDTMQWLESAMETAREVVQGLVPPVRETDQDMRAKLVADKMAIMWKRWMENLIDGVPKSIDEYLMKEIRKNLHKFNGEFVVAVTSGANLKVLMRRDPRVEEKLTSINRNISLLTRAQGIVDHIPQMEDRD